jgi:hypothetical protein
VAPAGDVEDKLGAGRASSQSCRKSGQARRGDPHAVVVEAAAALDRGDAQAALRRLGDTEDLSLWWSRWAYLVWLTFLAELAVASADDDLWLRTRAAIEPYADRWAVLAGAVWVNGQLRLWTARLDVALRRWDAAAFSAT